MSPQRQFGRAVNGNAKEAGPDAQLFAHAEALVARHRFTFDMPGKSRSGKAPRGRRDRLRQRRDQASCEIDECRPARDDDPDIAGDDRDAEIKRRRERVTPSVDK